MFISDNTTGAAPEVVEAISQASKGTYKAYAEDDYTLALERRLSDVFEKDVSVFTVPTGTSANALALSCLTPSYGSIVSTEDAHILADECGAIEHATNGARIEIPTLEPKITADSLHAFMSEFRDVHCVKPTSIAIAQATGRGLTYKLEDIQGLGECASEHGLKVHMDGARFANALASINKAPADITWRAGVKTLSFGGTKNGCFAAEAVILFDASLKEQMAFRRKQKGFLFSKGWFAASQFLASLENDNWLGWASHANKMASYLADQITHFALGQLVWPQEINQLFVRIPLSTYENLTCNGVPVAEWPTNALPQGQAIGEKEKLVRFVTSFSTTPEEVDLFVKLARTAYGGRNE